MIDILINNLELLNQGVLSIQEFRKWVLSTIFADQELQEKLEGESAIFYKVLSILDDENTSDHGLFLYCRALLPLLNSQELNLDEKRSLAIITLFINNLRSLIEKIKTNKITKSIFYDQISKLNIDNGMRRNLLKMSVQSITEFVEYMDNYNFKQALLLQDQVSRPEVSGT